VICVPTYKSLGAYRAALKKRANLIKKAGDKSLDASTRFMVNTAKRLAPKNTGQTIRGIRRRKNKKDEWYVESWVPGKKGFKQNMWANKTDPFKQPKMWWNSGKPTRYGDGTHKTTGTPGFFSVAAGQTTKHFRKMTIKNTRKALKAR